jgi:hypothetical protein
MIGDGSFHLIGPRTEYLKEIAVTILEVLENLREFTRNRFGIERKDAINNVIRTRFIGGVQIPRLGRRLERTDHHSRRIGAKIETLTI